MWGKMWGKGLEFKCQGRCQTDWREIWNSVHHGRLRASRWSDLDAALYLSFRILTPRRSFLGHANGSQFLVKKPKERVVENDENSPTWTNDLSRGLEPVGFSPACTIRQ